MSVANLNKACFSVDGREILHDISFNIEQGDFVCLLGANGAGKSTLTKLLNGLNKPSSGDVEVMGMNTKTHKVSALARQVGYLFQNPDRMLSLQSVRAELEFGLRLTGCPAAEIKSRAEETARMFGLEPDMNPLMSGRGQRQLTALASVVAVRPALLILDEPTTGLDWRECITIMSAVERMRREYNTTVFMVTHDMELAWEFGQRALVLSDGRIIADGAIDTVMRDEDTLRRASLLTAQIPATANLLDERFRGARTCEDMYNLIIKAAAPQRDA